MNPDVRNDVSRRLKCVEGHVHGVRLMVDDERAASDVLQQIHAIQGSLRTLRTLLLKEYVYECLQAGEARTWADDADLQQVLDQILQVST